MAPVRQYICVVEPSCVQVLSDLRSTVYVVKATQRESSAQIRNVEGAQESIQGIDSASLCSLAGQYII